jgi:phosphoglycolate phosphatase-like HAD superfamily hydrolase
MPQVVCLDFEGVICDSFTECLLVAWNCAHDGSPTSFSLKAVEGLPAAFVERFRRLRPYARHLGHFLVALLEDVPPIQNQEDFEAVYRRIPEAQVEAFARKITTYRKQVRRARRAEWLAAHHIYTGIAQIFTRCALPLYVVTARDRTSVRAVLNAARFCVPAECIYGDERAKVQALAHIWRRERVQPQDVLLVDDHLFNVLSAREAGYQAAWALWGCPQGEAKIDEAHGQGIAILHSVEELSRLLQQPYVLPSLM